ncbi:MAG: hypothetical protein WKF89_11040 [Chitinophagaceae bacterium]
MMKDIQANAEAFANAGFYEELPIRYDNCVPQVVSTKHRIRNK